MKNQDSNYGMPHHNKSLSDFEKDALKGEEILGGGKGTVILPGGDTTDTGDTGYVDDGTTTLGEDGVTNPV